MRCVCRWGGGGGGEEGFGPGRDYVQGDCVREGFCPIFHRQASDSCIWRANVRACVRIHDLLARALHFYA